MRYGEKIKINTIPKFDQDLILSSERLGEPPHISQVLSGWCAVPGYASPLTKNQMVVFSPYESFNNVILNHSDCLRCTCSAGVGDPMCGLDAEVRDPGDACE